MVDDHVHERVPQSGTVSVGGPWRRQLGICFPTAIARDVLGRVIEEGDQPGLPGQVGVAEFRKSVYMLPAARVCLAASRQQVRPGTGGVNRPPDGARLPGRTRRNGRSQSRCSRTTTLRFMRCPYVSRSLRWPRRYPYSGCASSYRLPAPPGARTSARTSPAIDAWRTTSSAPARPFAATAPGRMPACT